MGQDLRRSPQLVTVSTAPLGRVLCLRVQNPERDSGRPGRSGAPGRGRPRELSSPVETPHDPGYTGNTCCSLPS